MTTQSITPAIPRDLLAKYFGNDPRLLSAFEDQALAVEQTGTVAAQAAEATEAMKDAAYLTLSSNSSLPNERILRAGPGLSIADGGAGGEVVLSLSKDAAAVSGGYQVTLIAQADSMVFLPISGTLATRSGVETLTNKTLQVPKLSGLGDYADDAAAAAGGVPVGGVYRNGSALMVRVA